MLVILATHWEACGFFFIADQLDFSPKSWAHSDNLSYIESLRMEPKVKQYITSAYWALTTITTVGYGDISPVSEYEKVRGPVPCSTRLRRTPPPRNGPFRHPFTGNFSDLGIARVPRHVCGSARSSSTEKFRVNTPKTKNSEKRRP